MFAEGSQKERNGGREGESGEERKKSKREKELPAFGYDKQIVGCHRLAWGLYTVIPTGASVRSFNDESPGDLIPPSHSVT